MDQEKVDRPDQGAPAASGAATAGGLGPRLRAAAAWLQAAHPALHALAFGLWMRRRFRLNRRRIHGRGNSVRSRTFALNGVTYDIRGDGNTVEIGALAVLENVTFHITGHRAEVRIGDGCRLRNAVLWIEDSGGRITLGRGTTTEGVHLAATEDGSRITIGEDCMFAYEIDVRTGDSHGIYDQSGRRINAASDVTLGDHVWVGTRAAILKGAVIGAGSIVGTGAVVARGDYPAQCIIAGNPGKVVRQGVQWTRTRG